MYAWLIRIMFNDKKNNNSKTNYFDISLYLIGLSNERKKKIHLFLHSTVAGGAYIIISVL